MRGSPGNKLLDSRLLSLRVTCLALLAAFSPHEMIEETSVLVISADSCNRSQFGEINWWAVEVNLSLFGYSDAGCPTHRW